MQKQFAFITILYLMAKVVLFILIWMVTIQIQKKALEAKKKREALRQQQKQEEHRTSEKEHIKPEDHPFRR
ncbi:MAG: hypothetical protein GXX09_01560 [Syntrophomonadaceae bacterium]|nr:hypothetical protein [Syntrophomonadaceae bacterium]